jgi:hypothetical protein
MSITTDSAAVDSAAASLESAVNTLRATIASSEVAGGRPPGWPPHVLPLLERALATRLAKLLPAHFTRPHESPETLESIAQTVTGA